MRTPRAHSIDRAVARVLHNCGTYMCPENVLRAEVVSLVIPPPSASEIDDSIRHLDTERCLTGIPAPTGTKWKLSDTGRAWHAENS